MHPFICMELPPNCRYMFHYIISILNCYDNKCLYVSTPFLKEPIELIALRIYTKLSEATTSRKF